MNPTSPDALDHALDAALRRQFVPRVPALAPTNARLWWLLPIAAALPLVLELLRPEPETSSVHWEQAWSELAAKDVPLLGCSMGLDLRPCSQAKLGEGLDLRMQAPAFDARLVEDPRYEPWLAIWSPSAKSLLLLGRSEWPRPVLHAGAGLALHVRELGELVACEINADSGSVCAPLLSPLLER